MPAGVVKTLFDRSIVAGITRGFEPFDSEVLSPTDINRVHEKRRGCEVRLHGPGLKRRGWTRMGTVVLLAARARGSCYLVGVTL